MKQHNTCQPPGRPLAYSRLSPDRLIACHFFIPQRILQSVSMPHADTTGGPPRGRSLPPTGPAGGGQPADDRARTCMLTAWKHTALFSFFAHNTKHKLNHSVTSTSSTQQSPLIDNSILLPLPLPSLNHDELLYLDQHSGHCHTIFSARPVGPQGLCVHASKAK